MKKGLHRITALMLASILTLSFAGCKKKADEPTSDDETAPVHAQTEAADDGEIRHRAYQQIVQGIVSKYGFTDKEKMEDTFDAAREDILGLMNAKCIDITGDDKDELFCVYKAPDGIHMEVYEYENNAAKQAWDALSEPGIYFSMSVSRTETNEIYWKYSATRHFLSEAVTYRDGKYISSDDIEFTEEENNYISGAVAGLVDEGQRHYDVTLRHIGINPDGDDETLLEVIADDVFHDMSSDPLIDEWDLKIPEPKLSAQDVLAGIPYYGDRTKCVMDKKMAEAYAGVLENMKQSDGEFELNALLMDVAGDGMPLLITAYAFPGIQRDLSSIDDEGVNIWTWDGNTAAAYDFTGDSETGEISDYEFYPEHKYAMIRIGDGWATQIGDCSGTIDYMVKNAQITKVGSSMYYSAAVDYRDNSRARGALLPGVNTFDEDGGTYAYIQDLLDAGWVADEDDSGEIIGLSAYYKDGKIQSYPDYASFENAIIEIGEAYSAKWGSSKKYNIVSLSTGGSYLESIWGSGAEIAGLLRSYAQAIGRPSYSYDEVAYLFTDTQINALTKEIANSLDGEIGEIYKLSDDLYYVIIYVNDEPCGGAVVKNIEKGAGWRIISSDSELMTEAALRDKINADKAASNIKLDYSKTENGEKHLRDALNNIDGTMPNDAAKAELVSYIESCVSSDSQTTVKAEKNCVTITDKTIKQSAEKAASSRDKLNAVLGENGVALNKGISVVLHIACSKIDMGEPVQITLDSSVADSLGEAEAVHMILGDTKYSVRVTAEALDQAREQYGSLVIVLQKTGDNTYSIKFADAEGNLIDKLESGLTFAVPASDALCTVQAEYTGGTDNWGGQFDENNKTISFNTPYSGTYTVIEDNINITDIDGLTEDEQKAIRFMVSKGYFNTENDQFDPNGTLTRYDFSQALVKMFFALDKSLKCDFPDVTEDDPYYPYVASGVAINVIEGYDDGEFKGARNVLRDEVLALCSRTLREKKGYIAPENPGDYLHFTDAADIQDWARSEIALDVREDLITESGALRPAEEITRAESAQILYKLFTLLNEVEPVTLKSPGESSSVNVMPIIIVGGLGAISVMAIAAGVILLIRRKRVNKK
ncbi:MAG: S-layer homology domain-containing protein [Oscillospiraceae bacterium]|nr:S-layer homology domain-containing protein [Oscillospiraceae bacterium]